VLVVDDSALIRRFICDAIAGVPGIEVAGTAPNGRVAIAKVDELRPDVVTMDIEMPEMSGLEALPVLRASHPQLPIVMFSTLTVQGAAATLDALALGATDFVTKPSGPGGLARAVEHVRAELVPRIRALAGAPMRVVTPPRTRRPPAGGTRIDCVVVGVSTGGPRALDVVVPALPADLAVPVMIVQHMPPMFTKLLADRLDSRSGLAVTEATRGARVEGGAVFVAPGDHHLVVERDGDAVRTALTKAAPEHSCRPSACVLFRSALRAYGRHVLAVVLTGMGDDGSDGAVAIREAGGQVVVQDEATSVVWGMPGAVVASGAAEKQVPLEEIAPEIARRVAAGRATAPLRLPGGGSA
jgi:two-component system chemotaxis response regulator CheB